MSTVSNVIQLAIMTSGAVALVTMILVSLLTVAAGVHLTIKKRRRAMSDLLPLTWIPLCIGGVRSFMSLAEAINLIRTSNDAVESSLLIGMAVAPTLLGFVLSLPAFMVIAAGRAAITWRASVTKETSVVPKPHLKPASSNSMESLYEESERYLAKLTRSRES